MAGRRNYRERQEITVLETDSGLASDIMTLIESNSVNSLKGRVAPFLLEADN